VEEIGLEEGVEDWSAKGAGCTGDGDVLDWGRHLEKHTICSCFFEGMDW